MAKSNLKRAVVIGFLISWPCVLARSYVVPANVKDFYNAAVKNQTCPIPLRKGFYATDSGGNSELLSLPLLIMLSADIHDFV